jgi:hypothetical protein
MCHDILGDISVEYIMEILKILKKIFKTIKHGRSRNMYAKLNLRFQYYSVEHINISSKHSMFWWWDSQKKCHITHSRNSVSFIFYFRKDVSSL